MDGAGGFGVSGRLASCFCHFRMFGRSSLQAFFCSVSLFQFPCKTYGMFLWTWWAT